MRKRIVRADGELRVIRCVGVPGVENGVAVRCDGTLVDITEQGTATQELRRSQAYREQAEALSHTGSFGWNLSSRELVCSDETFRILEDDRSVNRHSISFERIHPEHLSSARLSVRNNRKRTSHVLRPHVLRKYDGSRPDVHVTLDRYLSDNQKETGMKASESLQNDQSTAAENALRLAVDTIPAFIHTARPDGYFDYFNRDGWIFLVSHSKRFVGGVGPNRFIQTTSME